MQRRPASLLPRLLEEPFRVFFPLGVVGALAGVLPWVWFHAGWQPVYPGYAHGLLQVQGFIMTFAVGFLMTALPRFLETIPTRPWELVLGWLLCAGVVACLSLGRIAPGELLFLVLMVHLILFAGRRLVTRGDDPPPFFAFLPCGLLAGLAGSALVLRPVEALPRLGELLVHQGILLCLVLAIGSHLGPRLLYGHRGFPETTTPAAHRRLAALFGLGLALLATFPLEAAGHARAALLLRALIVSAYLVAALGIQRLPASRLLHLHLLHVAFLSIAAGLWWAALAAPPVSGPLHLTLAGGFGLMTFVIATRVTVGHAGFEHLWDRHRAGTVVPLSLLALSVPVRLAAHLLPTLAPNLVVASAALWLLGAAAWGIVFVPKMSPHHVAPDD